MSESKKSVDLKDYQILKSIGAGGFSKVFLVKKITTNELFAAKVLNTPIDENEANNSSILFIYREVKLFSSLNHPSILGFIGYSPTDFHQLPYPTLITQYAPNGSLRDIIKLQISGLSPNGWDDTRKLINIYGIAAGLLYLHTNNIIHRDIKPENILMDDYLFPKIADFGLSKITDTINQTINVQSQNGYKGTPLYMSPEILEDEIYSFAGDVYAYSIVVYEILTGITPFSNLNLTKIIRKVSIQGERPPLTDDISEAYQELLKNCWAQNPSERWNFDEIIDNLKNNRDFITDSIDEAEYYNYIDYIDEYKSSFDITHSVHYKDLMSKKGRTTKIEKVSVNDSPQNKDDQKEPEKIVEEDETVKIVEQDETEKNVEQDESKNPTQHQGTYAPTYDPDEINREWEYLRNFNTREIENRHARAASCFPQYNPHHLSDNQMTKDYFVVLDIGTETTKAGLSLVTQPFFIPSTISYKYDIESEHSEIDAYDFFIGQEALNNHKDLYQRGDIYNKEGEINWYATEKFLEQLFFKYLRCDPEDHAVCLVEPYSNHKDFCESMAEIMFETFNCPRACFTNPAMPALASSWYYGHSNTTGCVVHFGVNSTDIVPVIEGYPLYDNVRSLNYGGTDVTEFIADIIKDREHSIPPEDILQTARYIKENYCKTSFHESYSFNNFDAKKNVYIVNATGVSSVTGKQFSYEVGYERFLGPSIYTHPEMIRNDSPYSVSQAIYDSIQSCPREYKVPLFSNIVFAGGSSMFRGLDVALQSQVEKIVDNDKKLNCAVRFNLNRRIAYAEWFGASRIPSRHIDSNNFIDRWQYMEEGINYINDQKTELK